MSARVSRFQEIAAELLLGAEGRWFESSRPDHSPACFCEVPAFVLQLQPSWRHNFVTNAPPHRLGERIGSCVHVPLRRCDAGVAGEQLQLVNGNAIVGDARERLEHREEAGPLLGFIVRIDCRLLDERVESGS